MYKPEIIGDISLFVFKDADNEITYSVVDDKSVKGDSLAKRRLRLLSQGVKLKRLRKAIFMLADLIKIATPRDWYIDSNGLIFRYVKSTSYALTSHEIDRIIPILTGGCIVQVKGIVGRFKLMFNPSASAKYASILSKGHIRILYNLTDEPHKPTRRMV